MTRARLYATFDRHTFWRYGAVRLQDDGPWEDVDADRRCGQRPVRGYAHVIKEDTVVAQPAIPGGPNSVFGFHWIAVNTGPKYKGHEFPHGSRPGTSWCTPRESGSGDRHGMAGGIWIVDDHHDAGEKLTPEVMGARGSFPPGQARRSQRLPAEWAAG